MAVKHRLSYQVEAICTYYYEQHVDYFINHIRDIQLATTLITSLYIVQLYFPLCMNRSTCRSTLTILSEFSKLHFLKAKRRKMSCCLVGSSILLKKNISILFMFFNIEYSRIYRSFLYRNLQWKKAKVSTSHDCVDYYRYNVQKTKPLVGITIIESKIYQYLFLYIIYLSSTVCLIDDFSFFLFPASKKQTKM